MRALRRRTLANQQSSINASHVNWTFWKHINFNALQLYHYKWRSNLVFEKHTKEIVSNTTEKRPKSLGAMKYNWKLRFSSHQGNQKRDPFSLILTLWQNDSERFSLHLLLCNRFNNSDDLCAGTKLHRKPSNLRINRHTVTTCAMILSVIPAIKQLPLVPIASQSTQKMSDWAQTTMTRAGTSLSYLHQREIQPSEPVSLERSDYEEQQENSEKQNKEKDGILE